MNGISILIVTYVKCSVLKYYIAWTNNTNLEQQKKSNNNEILVHTTTMMKILTADDAKCNENVE